MSWQPYAARLAEQVTEVDSPWRPAVAAVPRHLLIPRWFWHREVEAPFRWEIYDGLADPDPCEWWEAAYADHTWITRIGPVHADMAVPGRAYSGAPTSSATLPTLTLRMLDHAEIRDGHTVLDLGTGSGYSSALLAHRFGDAAVTSIDVDPYLVKAARDRLATIGLHPRVDAVDAASALPGRFDRIVATVSTLPVPPSWLAALRPGGKLVTTLTGVPAIIAVTKQADGSAVGSVVEDGAGFMPLRHADDYPPGHALDMRDARMTGLPVTLQGAAVEIGADGTVYASRDEWHAVFT